MTHTHDMTHTATTGRGDNVAQIPERSTTPMVTTTTPAPTGRARKTDPFRPYPSVIAYGLVAVTATVVALTGQMRPAAAIVLAAGITALVALTRVRRPITAATAGVASAITAAGIGVFEAAALYSVGPLVDAALFVIVTTAALAATTKPTETAPTDTAPGAR